MSLCNTRDRDNVWVDCTVCKEDEYQGTGCLGTADAVCKALTVCDSRYVFAFK